jgi:hypothetical protein
VLDALREELQLDPSQVAVTNPDLGNLSSASSPTAFCVRFAEGPAQYSWTVMAPLGTGLTYGAALLERVRDAGRDNGQDDHQAAAEGRGNLLITPPCLQDGALKGSAF